MKRLPLPLFMRSFYWEGKVNTIQRRLCIESVKAYNIRSVTVHHTTPSKVVSLNFTNTYQGFHLLTFIASHVAEAAP